MEDHIPPVPAILAQIIVLFLGIGLHEYAHCKFADMAGDPTPGIRGRVTLNLTKHFEPVGTMMIVLTTLAGFGIGWGRPAPMDPRKMKNPRWDFFAAVLAGPISNLLQAIVYALFFRLATSMQFDFAGQTGDFLLYLLVFGVAINLALFCFNLIPFGPLDGHWLLGMLLPEKPRYYWLRFNQQVGMAGLFIIVIGLQLAHIPLTAGPVGFGFKLLTGQSI
jgi:Zn-dependent protease